MRETCICVAVFLLVVLWHPRVCRSQGLLTSPINIAQGKHIEATATCGVGVSEGRELFCKLATVPGKLGIHGLACDHCEPNYPSKNHSIKYAIDGTERWWQSPPLSRGMKYQKVNITIDLGQEYQVAYVIVKTGNAPRPGIWALEKSADGGKTFQPWQYFATSASECLRYFGVTPLLKQVQDDTVICSIEYSQVPPFENGEIHISLVNYRPGASNFSYSKALQEWTRATHVRLRLLKVKTLLADLLPLAREDPTVTRRYFYSIKDISVGGLCLCYGHADMCAYADKDGSEFACQCKHNTCGPKCDKCCPGFEQKKWRPATAESSNECEACNCHGHATKCYYDERVDQAKRSLDQNGNYEGGGVCVDCQHNTIGINCQRCKAGYYKPTGVPKTSKDACKLCNCDKRFSTGRCYDGEGHCECLQNFYGPKCDRCNDGFYGFPHCKSCDCHPRGTPGNVCGPTGDQCPCKPNYTGAKCDKCAPGYYRFPGCTACRCDRVGAFSTDCDASTGQCRCRQMYRGLQCNQCNRGFYRFPECTVCNCDVDGTAPEICNPVSGRCICLPNFSGPSCGACSQGYFRFPQCRACNCSIQGSTSSNCDQNGGCECTDNYVGSKCDSCKFGFYKYPQCLKCVCDLRGARHEYCNAYNGQCICKGSYRGLQCNLCQPGHYGFPDCKACQCNPDGSKPEPGKPLGDCSYSNTGQCNCKDNVQGLACTECKPGSYNLQRSNPLGCEPCNCDSVGVVGGLLLCDNDGQCPCKLHVTGELCTRCRDGFYGLKAPNVYGCSGCECDVGGSYDQKCDVTTGQCRCRANVEGRDCSRPSPLHYFPSLFHIKVEMEDGFVPENPSESNSANPTQTPVRFGFDEAVFPGFSWRGYAVMSDLQRTVRIRLDIPKTASYRLLFYYILHQSEAETGDLILMRVGGGAGQLSEKVTFLSSGGSPGYYTVGGSVRPTSFLLSEGQWDMELAIPQSKLLLDYVVAVPHDYSEAVILEDKVTKPCQVNGNGELCNQFSYPSMRRPGFVNVEPETGYIITREQGKVQTQTFSDQEVLKQLDFNAMALLDDSQTRVTKAVHFTKPGKYVLVLQYYHPSPDIQSVDIYLRSRSTRPERGRFYLESCKYRFGCRQVAVDSNKAVKVFSVDKLESRVVTMLIRAGTSVAIDSVTAIPLKDWNLDYIVPRILCTTKDNRCIPSSYQIPGAAVKVDADEDADSGQVPPNILEPGAKPRHLQGGSSFQMTGSISAAGRYAVVMHYYQPNHVMFPAKVTVTSGEVTEGSVTFRYCPHASGCRAVVQSGAGNEFFRLTRRAVPVQIEIPQNSSVWIDYALLIPEGAFSQDVTEASPVPLSEEFVSKCLEDDFQVRSPVVDFCKKSIFSLTTGFLDSTQACACDSQGSWSDSCEEFGGQCPCKDHVIGRTCSRCKTGYYGFPNCRKCRCVFCNEVTGLCDCPPNTVGLNCELCLRGSFGFDPILGCQQCKCDNFGVINEDIVCDVKSGQCNCKSTHSGLRCDQCAVGYYGFPYCQKCNCYSEGVNSGVCDASDGKCHCKTGVTGDRCDKCAPGYFNLDAQNPDGCTKCWCSGLSSTCTSGDFYRSDPVSVMDGWALDNTLAEVTKGRDGSLTAMTAGKRINRNKPIYWIAPRDYLGKKIFAYGGKLSYSIRYDVPQEVFSPVFTASPGALMKGKNGVELQYKKQLNIMPAVTTPVQVELLEHYWESSGMTNITRDEFMAVLVNVDSLRLRASYRTLVADVAISDVAMELAVEGPLPGAQAVASIEICDCPAKANGSSCEMCGPGYTRSSADNRTCVPCNCFGHSDLCHAETGLCYNCLHNTTGNSCEFCVNGYYGDAELGNSDSCQMCACPLGILSNNFATECTLGADGMLGCVCKDGYSGPRCGKCADGFYGNPSEPGDYCKRCGCNGNIDPNVKGSCDSLTGKCLKCINGTTGDQCDRCIDGYYGDAAVHKNCTKCPCKTCGAESAVCDVMSGACECKQNVIGEECDKCKLNTWNYDSCLGCEDCDCAEASLGPSCDVTTGQCSCVAGVTGRRCDRCRAGFWDYSGFGCKACNCPSGAENLYGFCDVNTGQCCKPGGNCTICPRSYRLTPEGCEYCGDCVDRLLVTATELNDNITRVLKPLQSDVSGILVQTSLDEVNRTLQRLIPITNKYNVTMETIKEIVGAPSGKTPMIVPVALFPLNGKSAGKDLGPNHYSPAGVLYVMTTEGPYGRRDGSYKLEGDYIDIPNNGNLDTRLSTSIMLWVYHEGQAGPILHYGDSENERTVKLWLTAAGSFLAEFADRNKEVTMPQELTTGIVAPRTWHFVAAVYDYETGMASLWLNGTLAVELNIGQKELATASVEVRMGALSDGTADFVGRVSCLQFYDVALKKEQLLGLMNACKDLTGKETPTDSVMSSSTEKPTAQPTEVSSGEVSTVTTGGSTAGVVALPKPVAVYPFDGQSGGSDTGPSKYEAAQYPYVTPAAGPDGRTNGSFNLQGDYIEIPNGGNLDTKRSTSILFWVYHEGQAGPIIDYQEQKTVNLWLNQQGAFNVQFPDRNRGAPLSKALKTKSVAPRTWNYVSAVYDYQTGIASLWLNGKLAVEADIGQKELATDSKVVRMGSLSGNDDLFFGRVSCVQFYDVALTEDQISALMKKCQEDSGKETPTDSAVSTSTEKLTTQPTEVPTGEVSTVTTGGSTAGGQETSTAVSSSAEKLTTQPIEASSGELSTVTTEGLTTGEVALPKPVALYPFDDKSGGRDTGPNMYEAARFPHVTPATGPDGRTNGSFNLQGDYIEIPNSGNLDTKRSTSILLWVYHEGQTGPVLHYGRNKYPMTFKLWLTDRGGFSVEYAPRKIGAGVSMRLTSSPVAERTWHHVAAVYHYETGMASLWLNGTLVLKWDIGQKELATDSKVVRIGTLSGGNELFSGRVSCVQFYDVALAEDQISALMKKCQEDSGKETPTDSAVSTSTEKLTTQPTEVPTEEVSTVTTGGSTAGGQETPTDSAVSLLTEKLTTQPTEASSGEVSTVTTGGLTAGGVVALPQPVAVYPFDGQSGGRDIGPSMFEAAQYPYVTPATGPDAHTNGSFNLQGDYIEIPNGGNLDTKRSTSILLWVYHEGRTGPILHYGDNENAKTVKLWLTVAGRFRVVFADRNQTAALSKELTTDVVAPRIWYYVAAVYDYQTGKASLWLNGKLAVELDIGQKELATDSKVVRMGTLSGVDELFFGRVSCAQFYDEALTEDQISALMKKCQEDSGKETPTDSAVSTSTEKLTTQPTEVSSGKVSTVSTEVSSGKVSTVSTEGSTAGDLPKPVAVYPFDDQSGGSDAGPNMYDAAQYPYVTPATGPDGRTGGSLNMLGDYIEIPNGGNLDTKLSTSILLWVYHEGQTGPILHYGDNENAKTVKLWLTAKRSFSVVFADRDQMAALSRELTTDVVARRTWYYVAAVYDYQTGMASLWLNGKLAVEADIGQKELATDSKVVRMGTLSGVDELFFGRVSWLQFYNVALTEYHILALMKMLDLELGKETPTDSFMLSSTERRTAQPTGGSTVGVVPLPKPIAVYPLGDQSGGRDIGPNMYEAAQYPYVTPATGPDGRTNGSFNLQGDYIEIPNGGNLDTKRSTSILLWVYHEGRTGPVLHYGDNENTKTVKLWLTVAGSFSVVFADRNQTAALSKELTTDIVAPRTWDYVAAVYDYQTGKASLWLNGKLAVELDIGQKELATDSKVVRMGTLSGVDKLFFGKVSCVQFYDVALTEDQISALMKKCQEDSGKETPTDSAVSTSTEKLTTQPTEVSSGKVSTEVSSGKVSTEVSSGKVSTEVSSGKVSTVSTEGSTAGEVAIPKPVAVYPLDGQSGGRDIGPNMYDAAQYPYVTPVTGPDGRTNGSFNLQGDYIEISNGGNLDTKRSTSILLWVYHEGRTGPILHYGDNENGKTVKLWLTVAGRFSVVFADRNQTAALSKELTTDVVAPSIWYYVAAVYDYEIGKASLWLNGKLAVEADIGQKELATDSKVVRMGTLSGVDELFFGRVSWLQFYSVALTQNQILVLMAKYKENSEEETPTEDDLSSSTEKPTAQPSGSLTGVALPQPVAVYPFDGQSGGRDIGPNMFEAAQYPYVTPATGPDGRSGGSFNMEGDYIEISNGGNLDTKHSTSILLWVYHEGHTGPILHYGDNENAKTVKLWLTAASSFSVVFADRDQTAAGRQELTTNVVAPGIWHHVAAVYDYQTGMASLWLNGSLAVEADIGQKELATDSKVVRMGTLSGVDELFYGRVSLLQFYNVALTGKHISLLLKSYKEEGSLTPVIVPVALYPLNGVLGGKDMGPKSYSAAEVRYVTTSEGPYGRRDGSYKLEGDYIDIPNNGNLDTRLSTSIMLWVYHEGQAGPILHYGDSENERTVKLWLTAAGSFLAEFADRNKEVTMPQELTTGIVAPRTWHFVAAVYDYETGMASLWLNGTLAVELNIGQKELATASVEVRMGALSDGSVDFVGRVSCLQFYDVALKKEQLLDLMNACKDLTGQLGVSDEPADSSGTLYQGTEVTESESSVLKKRVSSLTVKSKFVLMTTISTKVEALKLEEEVMEALNVTRDVIKLAQAIAENFVGSSSDHSQLVEEAEMILTELQDRDFLSVDVSISDEHQLVVLAFDRAKSMLNDTLGLWMQVRQANRTLRELQGRFVQVLWKSVTVVEQARQALVVNSISKGYDSKVPIAKSMEKKQAVEKDLEQLSSLLQRANRSVSKASSSFQTFDGNFVRLMDLMLLVDEKLANLSKIVTELSPLVRMTQGGAQRLRDQADELEKLVTDTKQFAGKAINASRRYTEIAQALNDTLEIAMEAKQIACEANNKSREVASEAESSRLESIQLDGNATAAEEYMNRTLGVMLLNITERLQAIRNSIRITSQDLDSLTSFFTRLENLDDLADRLDAVQRDASESTRRAGDARIEAEKIEEQLPELSLIKRTIEYTNSNISTTHIDVHEAVNMSLNIKTRIEIIRQNHTHILRDLNVSVVDRIESILGLLRHSRQLLSSMKLVRKFSGSTVVNPLPPSPILESTQYTNISLYAKPDSPDGLLFFMGDTKHQVLPAADGKCASDFAAVEMRNRRVYFAMCVGNTYVNTSTKQVKVDGDSWYGIQAIMSENSAAVKVFDVNHNVLEAKRVISKKNAVFNIGDDSRIYVGGFPADLRVDSHLSRVGYNGCLDGLFVNQHAVGLWNIEKEELIEFGDACYAREVFQNDDESTFYLYGHGFLKFGPIDSEDPMGEVEFTFRSASSNALLMFGVDRNYQDIKKVRLFHAFELIGGRFVYSYNVGLGRRRIVSTRMYDSGKMVHVEKVSSRLGDKFTLKVTGSEEEVLANDQPYYPGKGFRDIQLVNAQFVFVGGVENKLLLRDYNIESDSYKGCIIDVKISKKPGELSHGSVGYAEGCEDQKPRLATFQSRSYLEMGSVFNKGLESLEASFAFRTEARNGLFLHEAHMGDVDFLTVGLQDGYVVLIANPGDGDNVLKTKHGNYGDGKWHFVKVEQQRADIFLYVDDEKIPEGLKGRTKIQTTSNLYVGGVPSNYRKKGDIMTSLVGTLRDVSFDAQMANLASYIRRVGVVFDEEAYEELRPRDLMIKTETTEEPPIKKTSPATESPTLGETTPTQGAIGPIQQTTTAELQTEPSTAVSTVEQTTLPAPTTAKPECVPPDEHPQELPSVRSFAVDMNSYAMYKIVKGDKVLEKLIGTRTKVQLFFKTSNPSGILLYTAQLPEQADFAVCYLERGEAICKYSAGSGIATLRSGGTYNDGKWHKLRLIRKEENGTLYVDDKRLTSGKSPGGAKSIGQLTKIFIGGLPLNFDGKRVSISARFSFPGCIKDFTVAKIDPGQPTQQSKTAQCYSGALRSGATFSEGGGFLMIDEKYTVGVEEEITLEIKPTTSSAIILSTYNTKGDYLVLEMIDGSLFFRAENGGGEMVAKYEAELGTELCDGQWHKIKCVKRGTVARLQVDDGPTHEGSSKGVQKSADIYDPLYVGGLPDGVQNKGVTTTDEYEGCIRALVTDGKTRDLSAPIRMAGNINRAGCLYKEQEN